MTPPNATPGARRNAMHIPVMVEEVVEWLGVRPEGVYLDATTGAGGHSRAILDRLTSGRLIAVDKDPMALEIAKENLAQYGDRVTFAQQDFSESRSLLDQLGVFGVDGIVADIGLSQMQIDSPERGFS